MHQPSWLARPDTAHRSAEHGAGRGAPLRPYDDVSRVTHRVTPATQRNRLLAALPATAIQSLGPHLEPVEVSSREHLYEAGRPIEHVYFPETMVVSFTTTLRDGCTVEVGTAGREGVVGLPVFLGDDRSFVQAIAQIPGSAMRIDVVAFARAARAPGPLHQLLLRYTQAFLTQVGQTAVCNAAHLVEQRCARWLLMTHDRVDGDDFPLTHEFLAFMLGVRRAGVTLAMRALQDARLVSYTRGRVTIVDRAGLERASCECYCRVRGYFERLLGHDGAA